MGPDRFRERRSAPARVGAAPWGDAPARDAAGHYRYALPKEFGGQDGTNLGMAVIREHLAAKGLGLHNDLQNEASIVANNPFVLMMRDFGTEAQKAEFIENSITGKRRVAFGLTEPRHGSDATWMDTHAVPETRDGVPGYLINGEKMWNTGMHVATHDMVFARTGGKGRRRRGITCFIVPTDDPGVKIEEYLWTFNMPTDHPGCPLPMSGFRRRRSSESPAAASP